MVKTKIMVIDDETDFLFITKLNLEQSGKFEVLTLPSPKDIISQFHSFRPQLVLLDMMMPGIGGLDACEMLNRDSLGKTVPIIILSALDKDVDKLRAYKVGVVDYLVKPVESTELIAKIEKALQYK